MPNSDERRAYNLLHDEFPNVVNLPDFDFKWMQFLKQKSHYGTPKSVMLEFLAFLEVK
jgi:hypothetical protein